MIAIVGTRNPTINQIKQLVEFLERVDCQRTIISGCARGIDERALREGYQREHKTVGVLPWRGYNREVQRWCSEIITLEKLSREEVREAKESVIKYHPAIREYPATKTQRAIFLLHARNYIIVRDAEVVVALPKERRGGTMQSIRVAAALGIPYTIID